MEILQLVTGSRSARHPR